MPSESYAASVARHTATMEELFTAAVESVPDAGERRALTRAFTACMTEVERLTNHRIQASDYEYQRREGQKLANLARMVAPRGPLT